MPKFCHGWIIASLSFATFLGLLCVAQTTFALDAQLQENKGVGVGFGMMGETQTTLTIVLRAPASSKIKSSYQRDTSGILMWTPQAGIQVEATTHTYTVTGVLPLEGHAVGFAGELTKESSGEGEGGGATTFEAAVADLDIDLPGLDDAVEDSETGGLAVPILNASTGFPETATTNYQELYISLDTKWSGSPPAGVSKLGTLTFTIEGASASGVAIYNQSGNRVTGSVDITSADYVQTYRIVTNNSFISTATIKASFQWETALSGSSQDNKADDVVRLTRLSVEIVEIDARFAPSVERMNLKYSIKPYGATVTAAKLEVFKKGDTTTPIFSDTSIPKTGQNVSYQQGAVTGWEGKTTGGDWIGPEDSDYTIKLSAAMNASFINPEKDEDKTAVEIESTILDFDSNGAEDCKFYMNDPTRKGRVGVIVKIKNKAGVGVLTEVPVKVHFSFVDPGGNNTPRTQSYAYEGLNYLGKADDEHAIFWAEHTGITTGSDDEFEQFTATCWAMTKTAGAEKGMTFVDFLPSAVGGDDFKITAAVKDAAGTTSIESGTVTIWRKIKYDNIYEMDGETHVSTNATKAIIQPYFEDAYVEYEVGARIAIPADKSVKYIGLWKADGDHQYDWNVLKAKLLQEIPVMTDAPAVVQAKAQAWVNRLDNAFLDVSMKDWETTGGFPAHSLVGIRYYHPKYSGITSEWNTSGDANPWAAGIVVKTYKQSYEDIFPDLWWTPFEYPGGFRGLHDSNSSVSSIAKWSDVEKIIHVIVHEVGHATRGTAPNGFYRQSFGDIETTPDDDDHTPDGTGGIMIAGSGKPTDVFGDDEFNPAELKILRGIIP